MLSKRGHDFAIRQFRTRSRAVMPGFCLSIASSAHSDRHDFVVFEDSSLNGDTLLISVWI